MTELDKIHATRSRIRRQTVQAAPALSVMIECGCGQSFPLPRMYRCFECRCYFCEKCGIEHWPEAYAARMAGP